MDSIDKIELIYLEIKDHEKILNLMKDEYKYLDDSSWTYDDFSSLLKLMENLLVLH